MPGPVQIVPGLTHADIRRLIRQVEEARLILEGARDQVGELYVPTANLVTIKVLAARYEELLGPLERALQLTNLGKVAEANLRERKYMFSADAGTFLWQVLLYDPEPSALLEGEIQKLDLRRPIGLRSPLNRTYVERHYSESIDCFVRVAIEQARYGELPAVSKRLREFYEAFRTFEDVLRAIDVLIRWKLVHPALVKIISAIA